MPLGGDALGRMADAMETLRAGDAAVTIDHDQGGRLSSFVVGDHELLVSVGTGLLDPTGWGCFPMAPWAGRIRKGRFSWGGTTVELPINMPPHAIHGTAHLERWTNDGPGALSCRLGPNWPWPGTVRQLVELSPDALSLTLRVESDRDPMPVSAGWHPWFLRRVGGVAVEIDLPAERMWRRDGDGIPDGSLVEPPPGPWDDCFTALTGPVTLRWPGVLSLVVDSDCDHVVVFDEQAHAVCVEPQTAPPDAHNSGRDLRTVTPGDPLVLTATWRWWTG